MKKTLIILIVISILLILPINKVKADMFDKPTAEVEVIGVQQDYYFEILIKRNNVKVLGEEELQQSIEYNYYQEDYPFNVLNGYQDNDGYASRTLYSSIPAVIHKIDNNTFKIGYFSAPTNFKIAIVLADDTIIVSKEINRKMFFSKMTFDLTSVNLNENQEGVGVLKEQIPYFTMIWKFIVRVILTVSVELLILMLFKYKLKGSFIFVGAINIFTQSLLTIFMMLSFYFWGAAAGLLFTVFIGEILIFLIEIITYGKKLKEHSSKRAMLYGLVANLVTVVLTFLTFWFI